MCSSRTATIATRPQKGGNGYWVEIRQLNGKDLADGQFAMNLANRVREAATSDPEFRRSDGTHISGAEAGSQADRFGLPNCGGADGRLPHSHSCGWFI